MIEGNKSVSYAVEFGMFNENSIYPKYTLGARTGFTWRRFSLSSMLGESPLSMATF